MRKEIKLDDKTLKKLKAKATEMHMLLKPFMEKLLIDFSNNKINYKS
jgi:hypothetical protein